MTKFTVIGAGMAGLLAGAMLREECKCILEAQKELPNNHAALLRFRSSIVGDAVNIPFKEVQVIKAVDTLGNPIADAISYSRKTNGTATLRSLITANGALESRWVAPDNFVSRLFNKVPCIIHFNKEWDGSSHGEHIISTLPMPSLMKLLEYPHELEFRSIPGYVTTANLRDTDLYATIYLPSEHELAYRASITGSKLIIEYAFPNGDGEEKMEFLIRHPNNLKTHIFKILTLFGMNALQLKNEVPEIRPQRYAKILPVPDDERKRFMLWASETHRIYSLGRFATWRPGLLMDDLVNDIRVIQRLAKGGGSVNYDIMRKVK